MLVRWWWRAAFVAAVVVQSVVLYAPSTPGPPAPPGTDKLIHAAVFAAVGLTAVRVGWRPVPVLVVLLTHAVLSEAVQHFLLPARSGDPLDAVADGVGAVIGVLFGARRTRREPS